MTCAYNLEVLSYGEMAVLFTRIIMDMDVLRYHKMKRTLVVKTELIRHAFFRKK